MKRALVIAYGNPLRGDDGAAWAVADELRSVVPDSVEFLHVHQLSPETAEIASMVDVAVFLDAAADGVAGDVHCLPVAEQRVITRFWHHIGPGEVLALCRQLYGKSPQGFLVTVCGERFDFAFALSDTARKAIPMAVAEVSMLLERHGIACADATKATA